MHTTLRRCSLRRCLTLLMLAALASCAQPPVEGPPVHKGADKPGATDAATGSEPDFSLLPIDAAPRPPCKPVTCADGPYCAEIGDGCGGRLTCGACSGDL